MIGFLSDFIKSSLYTGYAVILLFPLAEFARYYPPGSAPNGLEGLGHGKYIFIILMFGGVFILKRNNHYLGRYSKNLESTFDIPLRIIIVTTLYYTSAILATYTGDFMFSLNFIVTLFFPTTDTNPFSWASFGIVAVQAILLGMIFELGNRPKRQWLAFVSNEEINHHIKNWRQFTQILLTSSVALGIGFFLQSYSKEYMNAKHMVVILGSLAIGILLCLIMVRQRILRLGSFLK